MSAGLLIPDIVKLHPRLSPGFCSASYGAVEAIDWRDELRVGTTLQAQQPLRTVRNSALYNSFVASLPSINGTVTGVTGLAANSGWYIRSIWRKPYENETLYYSPSTADGVADTSAGYSDGAGNVIGEGAFWRHKRACFHPDECFTDFFLYRDNCRMNRTAVYNETTARWSLSECAIPLTGESAYLDPVSGEAGRTFNETFYYDQFANNLSSYPWYGSVDRMDAEGHLHRNYMTYTQGYGSDNITEYWYGKHKITYSEHTLEVAFEVRLSIRTPAEPFARTLTIPHIMLPRLSSSVPVRYWHVVALIAPVLQLNRPRALAPTPSPVQDASMNAFANIPLFLAIVFSLLIAVTCGVGAIAIIIYFGLKYLAKVNKDIETAKKLKAQRIALRKGMLLDEIQKEKEDKGTQAPKNTGGVDWAFVATGTQSRALQHCAGKSVHLVTLI